MKVLSSLSSVYSLKENKNDFRNDPYFYNEKFVTIYNFIKAKSSYKIGDLFDIFTGISPTGNYSKEGIPFIRIQDLEPFGVFEENVVRVKEENTNKVTTKVQKYDILLAITGATIGKVSIYLGKKHAFCTSDILVLRPKQKLSIEKIFGIYTLFLSQHYLLIFKKGVTGVSNQHLNPKYVYEIPVILNEKVKKIGNKLKQAIEAKIEAERKRGEVEEIYRDLLPSEDELIKNKKEVSTVLRLQDVKKIKRIDPQFFSVWIRKVIEKLNTKNTFNLEKNKFLRGKTPSESEYTSSGVFVVKVRNILQDGRIEIKGDKSYIDESNFKKNYKNFIVKDGDIIFVATGKGSIGRVGIFLHGDINSIASGELLIYREKDEIKRWLILGLFLQKIIQDILDKIALGPSGQTHLYPEQIVNIPIPILSEEEAKNLIENLSNYFFLMEKSKQLHSQSMKELNKILGLNYGGDNS